MPSKRELLMEEKELLERRRKLLMQQQRPQPDSEGVNVYPVHEDFLQESFPTNLTPKAENIGEIGSFVGELGGSMLSGAIPGGGVARGLARVGISSIGAGVGSQAERLLRTGKIDLKQGGMETLLSLGPEAAEETIRASARGALRWTRGGRELASDEAAHVAETLAERAYAPPSKAQAKALFRIFDQPGITGSLQGAKRVIDGLEDGGVKNRLIRQLKSLDKPATDALMEGGELNLKQLQDFRSLIGDQAGRIGGQTGGARTQRLMRQVQGEVDKAIDARLDMIDLPGAAQSAREAWHRLKASERLHDFISKPPITRFMDPKGDTLEFNILSMRNQLLADRGRLARRINVDLDKLPGAREGFTQYLGELQQIVPSGVLTISDVSGARRLFAVAAADRMISSIITSRPGRALFARAAAYGRGRISFNSVAMIFNIIRRANLGAGNAPSLQPSVGAAQPFFGATTRGQGLAIPPATQSLR